MVTLGGANDLARLEALGADPKLLRSALDLGPDSLQVGQPPALGSGSPKSPSARVDVPDVLTKKRALPAHGAGI